MCKQLLTFNMKKENGKKFVLRINRLTKGIEEIRFSDKLILRLIHLYGPISQDTGIS